MRFLALQAVSIMTLAPVLWAPVAGATSFVLQPSSQDAFVTQDKPNRIAGAGINNTRIRVMSSTPNPRVRRGLVQFDLSTIPASATITSAIVEIYEANNPGVSRLYGLHRILAPWLQSAVKWRNQPSVDASPADTASVGMARGFVPFDVTSDVQQAVNICTTDHGWMVKDQSENTGNIEVNWVAKEERHIADLPNKPRMTVTFTAPTCVTDADCADANPCSTNEHCVGGFCAVDEVNCDDNDPCTDDVCDCQQGCINSPICNDGLSCTTDTCDPDTLECTNTPVDAACATDCSTGTCIADPDNPNIDPDTGCIVATTFPDGTLCTADADQCTDDVCQAGTCMHPLSAMGTPCAADGNPCTDDVCDGSGVCGVDNTAPCDDGNTCTIGDQCSGGSCVGNSMTCGDGVVQGSCGEECDDSSPGANCTACRFICGPAPAAGCRAPALAQKGLLVLKDKSPDKRDALVWKWVKGGATAAGDYGDPLTTTGYTLCVYDASANAQPLLLAMAPPGGTCAGKPCWKAIAGGFKYKDKDLTPDGLSFLLEKAGAAKKAKAIVKGKGANLGVPALPLTIPVTVQLERNDDPSICWTATYGTTIKNQTDQFKAHAD
jgi:hypothetical protein